VTSRLLYVKTAAALGRGALNLGGPDTVAVSGDRGLLDAWRAGGLGTVDTQR
jgi:hypothetical protein